MPQIYRVAVIGNTGRGNYGHGIDTVWGDLDNCEVVAVADPDEKGRAEAAKRVKAPKAYADYRQMLDEAKADIVAVCPRWIDEHRDMVVAAAEHGCHIYMEKAMCRTPAEADEMIAACEKNKVRAAIAHQTRYSPRLQAIRDLIADDKLGTILEFRGRGKEDQRGGGEDLWVLGSHIMNLIDVFGGDPLWCFARVEQNGKPITKADVKPGNEGLGSLAGDTVSAMYGMSGGATAYFGSKRGTAGGRFGLQIYGTKGILEILTGDIPSVQFLPDPAWSPGRSGAKWVEVSSTGIGEPEPFTDGGLEGGNVRAVRDLIQAIEEDRQPECSLYEGRTVIEMICGVFESARVNGPVSLPLKNRGNPLDLMT